MLEIGELLEAHVRREERELFPLIESRAAERLEESGRQVAEGPVWGQTSDDLNATLLAWGPGAGPAEHVNDERDVLLFVTDGGATVTIDDEVHDLGPGDAVIVAKGQRRKITAGRSGVRYLSVHRRRPSLQIETR
jgi:quercetin dioxygenase-like cupin family protein